ncbi:hypothetical protein QAD02_015095 [Eretmocerus hayati]|uniref:Uncharacterized protein n=1 Tax=Eretmocerus hayati TaxID=131215 RepID=A0ACC2P873_9HYME|nr:hypothetical protein QAD02_015095 [Eretmocerus hayati]
MATTVLVKRAPSVLLAVFFVIGYSEAYHLAQHQQSHVVQPSYDQNNYHGATGHSGFVQLPSGGGYHHQGIAAPQQHHQPQVHHVIVHPVIDRGHVVQETPVHQPQHTVTGHFGGNTGHHQQHHDYNDYNHGSDNYDFHGHQQLGTGHNLAGGHQHSYWH